ncbi:uncharacterized protein LOC120069750 isoform X1 [Benincasa hispida]|uniref:uncharacterized protein LOC120069750 isoform X1 n=1 Tax=Benincasa hispida TaxID=102211 RepID=UPI0019029F9C|nr:uncharacterized protein LOC120069750 isoform X1 [Benincasa hispida]
MLPCACSYGMRISSDFCTASWAALNYRTTNFHGQIKNNDASRQISCQALNYQELLFLSLEALMKTQNDDVRLKYVDLLMRRWFSMFQYILVSKSGLLCGYHDPFMVTQMVNIYGFCRSVADASCDTSYGSEVERILFQLVTESEWDMHSSRIHRPSLVWLFKQEKIRNPLCYQVLKICQIHYELLLFYLNAHV